MYIILVHLMYHATM